MYDHSKEINLFTELGCHPVPRVGVILIPKNEVLQCSEKLLNQGIRILGYEGFIMHENDKIQPSLERIANYSSIQPALEDVKSFLGKLSSEITHLEIDVDL
jgi:hypothetical protein